MWNNKRFLGFALATVLLLGVALTGCSDSKGDIKVKVGEVTRSVFYAPEYVALEKGFFKEEGLDVDLQTIAGGDKTMTALLSGAIDVALVGSETPFTCISKERMILSLTSRSSHKRTEHFLWLAIKRITLTGIS